MFIDSANKTLADIKDELERQRTLIDSMASGNAQLIANGTAQKPALDATQPIRRLAQLVSSIQSWQTELKMSDMMRGMIGLNPFGGSPAPTTTTSPPPTATSAAAKIAPPEPPIFKGEHWDNYQNFKIAFNMS